MRVCIPIEFRPEGGGFYFLQIFSKHLQTMGWSITADPRDHADVLFTNHWMTSTQDIFKAIRCNPSIRIVQRIDGAAQNYGRDPEADLRQAAVNQLADLTIFQSQYARYSTREKFSVIKQDGPVIYNPVDLNVFHPAGDKLDFGHSARVACVTWSINKLKGHRYIYEAAKTWPAIGFVLCGNYPDAPDLPNIYKLGVLDRLSLAVALRSCQALLTFSENEACPNHVLEGLATGLPILYADSGAMKEVIGDCGLPTGVETVEANLSWVLINHAVLSAKSRQRAKKMFNPNTNLNRYITEIEDLFLDKKRSMRFSRTLQAWSSPFIERLRAR